MAASHLTAVPTAAEPVPAAAEVYDLGRVGETAGQRISRLQREARLLAREQIETFARDLDVLAKRAAEIAEGGDVYPVGARELASRLADDFPQKAQLLTVILARVAQD